MIHAIKLDECRTFLILLLILLLLEGCGPSLVSYANPFLADPPQPMPVLYQFVQSWGCYGNASTYGPTTTFTCPPNNPATYPTPFKTGDSLYAVCWQTGSTPPGIISISDSESDAFTSASSNPLSAMGFSGTPVFIYKASPQLKQQISFTITFTGNVPVTFGKLNAGDPWSVSPSTCNLGFYELSGG